MVNNVVTAAGTQIKIKVISATAVVMNGCWRLISRWVLIGLVRVRQPKRLGLWCTAWAFTCIGGGIDGALVPSSATSRIRTSVTRDNEDVVLNQDRATIVDFVGVEVIDLDQLNLRRACWLLQSDEHFQNHWVRVCASSSPNDCCRYSYVGERVLIANLVDHNLLCSQVCVLRKPEFKPVRIIACYICLYLVDQNLSSCFCGSNRADWDVCVVQRFVIGWDSW